MDLQASEDSGNINLWLRISGFKGCYGIREAIAARIMRFAYIKSEEKVSDDYSVCQRKIRKKVYNSII
jgi:hypothetical protein